MGTRQGWQKYRSRCQSGIYNFYFVEIGWSLDPVGGGNIFDSVQVRSWKTKGRGAKMCTARPSWMSISQQSLGYKDNMYKVAVGDLQDILEIDKDSLLVTVQPGVTIGLLNR